VEYLLVALKLLPQLLKFATTVVNYVQAQEARGMGRKEAMMEALEIGSREVQLAEQVKRDADKLHDADPTDDAFDREFERKTP
jgi:hypothetical protein